MNEFSITGGARVGWVNASWPFATLKSNKESLTIASLGQYTFSPEQVVSFEKYGAIPFISSGIRIKHNRNDYPETIIFWCLTKRDKAIENIKLSGFIPKGKPHARVKGFPIRWSVIIAFIVIWNVLFLLNNPFNVSHTTNFSPMVMLPLFLICAFSTLVQKSERMQSLVLNEGHQIGEVKSSLLLLQIISGLLSVIFFIIILSQQA